MYKSMCDYVLLCMLIYVVLELRNNSVNYAAIGLARQGILCSYFPLQAREFLQQAIITI